MTPQPGGTAPILELVDVGKSFGDLRVIERVSLAVPSGQALGVVGPNGAGKSTLLNVIAGQERASRGSVHLDGADVTRRSPDERCRLGIGRSYQIPRPFTHLTVFENALVAAQYGGRLRGKAAQAAALDALAVAGLLPASNVPSGQLPLLGRKRMEMARALATQPRLLLLDEIAGGLTEAEADELVGTISSLKRTGINIIWIEHVVKALVQVVDRLVCLASGVLIKDGAPDEVLKSEEVLRVYLGSELE
ncbi:MAG: ATP-binding cassette domain-containing protein [Actinobacteria bacterium]|nr:ATP-binding cassette domain-containing protein [Actinomycetota bacterium]MBI3686708.1 ATP-binding cassette domain-containing protein [Actinomycetota bacterium]